MLWAPAPSWLADGEQVAVAPETGTAEHPAIGAPLSVKLTVPAPVARLSVAV